MPTSFPQSKISNLNLMAFLKEDSQYTHIVAIDFGTGASG